MTREEHIYQLKQYLRGHSICMCPSSSIYWKEHWEEVIKALEQEPFINKPCVSSEVCEHDKNIVLDKIRADIEHLKIVEGGDDYVRKMAELFSLKVKVLQIIDKYKAETEEI